MEIVVDLKVCRSYANCIIEAPDVFDYDDVTGKVVVLQDHVDDSLAEDVRRAALSCPVHAITVLE